MRLAKAVKKQHSLFKIEGGLIILMVWTMCVVLCMFSYDYRLALCDVTV